MEQKQWGRERVIHSSEEVLQYQEKGKAAPPELVEAGMFHGMQWNTLMVFFICWELQGNAFHAQGGAVLVSGGDKTSLAQTAWALWT